MSRVVRCAGFAALCLVGLATRASAQNQLHPRWEVPGFDFRPNGAWRVKAQRVAQTRRQLIAQRSFSVLNAPPGGMGASATVVTGTLTVPTVFFGYSNTDPQFMRDTAQYDNVLFGTSKGPNGENTLRTYYEEMSTLGTQSPLFHLTGKVMGWAHLAGPESNYTGGTSCSGSPFGNSNCNGIWSSAAVFAMQNGLREALAQMDATIDFGQFDNDGPDGIPNSGDDDGYVDMIMFAHPTRDGACGGTGNNHIWSHRFVLVNSTETAFQDYETNDTTKSVAANAAGHHHIRISDYFATSALGGSVPGSSPCDTSAIMPIGTAAHEFGHALGLPDLYDTQFTTEGIGNFGLMGSGNFTGAWSPSRMESWSLNELGWVTIVPLTTRGTYGLGAAPVSDTAYMINVQGSNPRNEFFLVDNRQASQADTALIRILCARSGNPVGCSGGLLIWHVDDAQISGHGFHSGNSVNVGPIHGLRLMQADGLGQLDDPNATGPRRRGDAGDPYPGITANTGFTPRTNPSPVKNVDGSFAGFTIDSIKQLVPGAQMSFRLRFGNLTIVRGTDTAAVVQVDGANFNVFRDLLDDGTTHLVNIATTQLSADGRSRFTWLSWSDGGAQSHTFIGSLGGTTITANLKSEYKLIAAATTGGHVAADTNIDLAGTFLPLGRSTQLTATPDPGQIFYGWTGDVASNNAVISVPMDRPYTVTANFAGALTTSDVVAQLLGPTRPLSAAQVNFLDSQGNKNGVFDVGDFLAWVKTTGAPVSPALVSVQQLSRSMRSQK